MRLVSHGDQTYLTVYSGKIGPIWVYVKTMDSHIRFRNLMGKMM